MASKVQIAKLALQHIGDKYDITSLSEATPEAEQVNLVFDDVRDMTLRAHPWKFAVKYSSPAALVAGPPDVVNWTYAFTYPADCLKVLNIVNPLGRDKKPVPFEIANDASDNKVIMANEEEPTLRYIKQETDSEKYDPLFVMALSYRIAQYIAIPITGDRGMMNDMKQLADEEIGKAAMESANEGIEAAQTRDPDWITARS